MEDFSRFLPRYKALREDGRKLNDKLVERIPIDVMHEAGRKLGMLRDKTFVFDTEDESAVLMDYCLYDVRRGGRTLIEKYQADSAAPLGSAEHRVLEGLAQARYSVYQVEQAVPGVGVHAVDLMGSQDERVFLMDVGFGSTASRGLCLATRLVPHGEFWTTGGAALPIGTRVLLQKILDRSVKFLSSSNVEDYDKLNAVQRSEWTAVVIRACLHAGACSKIVYENESSRASATAATGWFPSGGPQTDTVGPIRSSQRVGRNDPCPCGSGLKFKRCCGTLKAAR